jgi:hypothetical protein
VDVRIVENHSFLPGQVPNDNSVDILAVLLQQAEAGGEDHEQDLNKVPGYIVL